MPLEQSWLQRWWLVGRTQRLDLRTAAASIDVSIRWNSMLGAIVSERQMRNYVSPRIRGSIASQDTVITCLSALAQCS
jgi:hypothetical protein